MIPTGTVELVRAQFGGTTADFVGNRTAGNLLRLAPAAVTMWDAQVGGTPHTDLLLNGAPVDSVRAGSDGQIPIFQGPPGVQMMWADPGTGVRVLVISATYVAEFAASARESAAAAQAALEDVHAIGTSNDTAIAGQISTPGSDTDDELKARYARVLNLPTPILNYVTLGGATDQTANVQAAVNATPAGGALDVPAGFQIRVDGQINRSTPITISSSGRGGFWSGVAASTPQKMFSVTSSDVMFKNLKLAGPQFTNQVGNQTAIHVVGASAAAPLRRVSVVDCDISSWGFHGIYAQYVNDFTFDNNTVRDINYAAIGLLSCISGTVSGNQISNVVGDFANTGNYNAYGIFLSRAYGTLAAEPRTSKVSVVRNVIKDIPTWVGIDSHGGSSLTIGLNTITNTSMGISMVSSQNGAGVYVYGPLDISISGNTIDSGVTNGTRNAGIVFVANPTEFGNGSISGNTIRGHGFENNGASGGIQIQYTRGLSCKGNVLVECSPIGVSWVSDNVGFVCEGNTVTDVWSNSVVTKAVAFSSVGNNSGHVANNTLLVATKVATKTAANGLGVYVADASGNAVRLGDNTMTAAGTPLHDLGNLTTSQLGEKPSISGSRGGNAALASVLDQLAKKGLITNNTTA